jgi:hypothetical protein
VEKWTTRATPLSSETGFFGKRSKAGVKKEKSPGNSRTWIEVDPDHATVGAVF